MSRLNGRVSHRMTGRARRSNSVPVSHTATRPDPMVLIHSTGREMSTRRRTATPIRDGAVRDIRSLPSVTGTSVPGSRGRRPHGFRGHTGLMRMMLLTAGTRGDVEPFAALARHAASRGHKVRLALPDDAAAPEGVDSVALGLDAQRVLSPTGRTPWALARHVRAEVRPAMRRMLAAAVRETAAFDPDVVVHHPLILS